MKARIKRTYVVYSITNTVTDKRYIGMTDSPEKRKIVHFSLLRNGKHHSTKLQNSYNKHGADVFTWEILETKIPKNKIKQQEVRWVELFDSCVNGYNHTKGGDYHSEGRPKPCVWNGVHYSSRTEAARTLGVPRHVLEHRLKMGYTCDEMLFVNGRPVTWNGMEYVSVVAASRALRVSEGTMNTRLKRGWACDEDIPKKEKPVMWDGKLFPSVQEAAKALGVSRGTMIRRIKNGYTTTEDLIATKANHIKLPPWRMEERSA